MESLKDFCQRFLRHTLAKDITTATMYDKYLTVAYAVRGHLTDRWIETQKKYHEANPRRVYYLSMEYVLGKSLRSTVLKLGIEKEIQDVSRYLGVAIDELYDLEDDFDLGNGGRGRFAACIQEALATRAVAGMGYGLRYDYAAFRQEIRNGSQYEAPRDWLHTGHPWEIIRPEHACEVWFGGTTRANGGAPGARVWNPAERVVAMPYDYPVAGYRNGVVNTIRLWSARAAEVFPADYLHHGDYLRACEETSVLGTLTKVLFPEENILRAIDLRLRQQYFFVAASLRDIVRRYRMHNDDILQFADKVAIHVAGSRCALAVPELIRLLVDVEGVPWKTALEISQKVFSYTTYGIVREHVEMWPVYMITQLFPRHMEIVYELNQVHLDVVRTTRKDLEGAIPQLSLIEEGEVKRVRMSPLALLGSSHICGVSRAQTESLTTKLFPQFYAFMPDKFATVTAGISLRHWLLGANRPLANLISQAIGDTWIRKPADLLRLERLVDDSGFLDRLLAVKRTGKERLATLVKALLGFEISPDTLFDVHNKKIHPYKRQVLHLLNILTRYLRIRDGGQLVQQRTHIFAGKASPSDRLAKQIIRLIHIVADLVNSDPAMAGAMRVIFIPDYGMTWAERLIPSVDLSEQVPTPGLEASGTSNMKMALNGAVSIVSRSGSNIEMIERIGEENLVPFGTGEAELPSRNAYRPWEIIRNNQRLGAVFDFLEKHLQKLPDGASVFPLLASLRDSDEYYVLFDYEDYVAKQDHIDELYAGDRRQWARRMLLGCARIGWFSTDRAVEEYAASIWHMDEA